MSNVESIFCFFIWKLFAVRFCHYIFKSVDTDARGWILNNWSDDFFGWSVVTSVHQL